MGSSSTTLVLAAGVLSLLLLRQFLRKERARLPPGPSGLPVIGNVLDMPSVAEWRTFAEWGRKYGRMCSVTLLGQPIVILNSVSALEEMDTTKGSVFSTRPRLPMAGELVGYDQTLVLIAHGPRFRTYRKYFARLLGTPAVLRPYVSLIEAENQKLMKRLLLNPSSKAIDGYLRKLTGAIILRITYGIEVQEQDDPFVSLIEKANDNFNVATSPGAFLVDVFPALLYIPELLAPFKRTARAWARDTQRMVEEPYGFVRRQMAAGSAPVSFVSSLLEDEEKMSPEDVRDVKYTAASLYGGGADTTAASLYAFFLAMVRSPEVQRRGQAEIDALLHGARLPRVADRNQLPYVSAMVTELLRWHSVAPLGVPHAAMEDAVVDGYLIPKGTIIIGNLWSMMNNPEVYPQPATFDPTRYLTSPPQPDPRSACFGFGRRVCPGRELAEASLFMCVAMTLSVFDILPAEGPLPVHENTQGTISHTKPFDCVVKPRSERAVALISGDV
ncbi:cytochrome P450 [Roridomyces roridus]|uniref:Cytochrome P450 n=1 Tax=Roridomyces roridus TaxID=1738132 RepID=A0AAD7FM90_9AGAR|nr:cytochrome P450 [Roridomyces roridus]